MNAPEGVVAANAEAAARPSWPGKEGGRGGPHGSAVGRRAHARGLAGRIPDRRGKVVFL